jgi:hypothetical protein
MKIIIFLLSAILSGSVAASDFHSDYLEPGALEHAGLETVVSDDGALRMSVVPEPSGRAAALIVVDQASGETFVFSLDGLSDDKNKQNGRGRPGVQNEGGGDSGGGIPDGASIDLMGCWGSVCTYAVTLGDEFLGTLIVDYSGPQPKAMLVPPQ